MTKDKGLSVLKNYKATDGLDDAERAAEFLFWASKKMPGRPVPIMHIVKAALALPTLPGENSKRVEDFKKRRMSRVRDLVFIKYERAVLSMPGFGYRCTVSSEDTANTYQEAQIRRFISAGAGIDKARSIINAKDLKGDTLKRFNDVGVQVKRLQAPLKKLRAPEEDED